MSNVKEPILTEKTGIRIAEAIELSNAYAREQTSHMAQQTAFMKVISNRLGGEDIYFVTGTFDGENYAITSDVTEVSNAYTAGRQLILLLTHGEYIYAYEQTKIVENDDGSLKAAQFGSGTLNPSGAIGTFTANFSTVALSKSTQTTIPAGTKELCLYIGNGDRFAIENALKFAVSALTHSEAVSTIATMNEVAV